MSIQNQLTKAKPTYQEVEQALINVVKAGIYYRKPKDGKFMQNYKEKIIKLRRAEDPEEYILKLAITKFSNKEKSNQIMNDHEIWYANELKIHNSIMKLNKLFYKLEKIILLKKTKLIKKQKISLIQKRPETPT